MAISFLRAWWTNKNRVFLGMLLWMAVIFSFSTFPGKETAGPPPLWYFIERKGAHVFEYALLLLLSFRYFELSFVRESFTRVLGLAVVFTVMYGVTDELHQFFVPLRGARMSDVLIDGLGTLLGVAIVWFLMRHKKTAR